MPEMTGGEAFARALLAGGVKYAFGVPGTSGMGLTDALIRGGKLGYFLALHEMCALSMADGCARASGQPAVALVSVLPGTANSVGGLYNAYRDRSPLLVVSAQQDNRVLGRDSHTETSDLVEVTRQVTKWSWEVPRADRLVEAALRAIKVATSPPAGPVFLSVPSNLLDERLEIQLPSFERYRVNPRLGVDRDAIARAAAKLLAAQMPLIVGGSGVTRAGASELLVKIAELLGAPVVAEPRYSYLPIPTDHPYFFPLPEITTVLEVPGLGRPDVILAVGCRLIREYRHEPTPAIGSSAFCIHMDEDPWEIGKIYQADLGLVADAYSALTALLAELQAKMSPGDERLIAARREGLAAAGKGRDMALAEQARDGSDSRPVRPWHLARELRSALRDDAILVNESPTTKSYLVGHYRFGRPENYFASSSAGCLGWGLPAALGVKLAMPERQVVACLGDGSLMFSVQALWTASNYHIPLVIVVFNNGGYVAVKNQCRARGILSEEEAALVTDFGAAGIDFAKVSAAFGLRGERVQEPPGLRPALGRALAHGGPALVDVLVTPEPTA